jgi:hypothetical protein
LCHFRLGALAAFPGRSSRSNRRSHRTLALAMGLRALGDDVEFAHSEPEYLFDFL